eukprot:8555083-Pyramimonas_sp.AAC.1
MGEAVVLQALLVQFDGESVVESRRSRQVPAVQGAQGHRFWRDEGGRRPGAQHEQPRSKCLGRPRGGNQEAAGRLG